MRPRSGSTLPSPTRGGERRGHSPENPASSGPATGFRRWRADWLPFDAPPEGPVPPIPAGAAPSRRRGLRADNSSSIVLAFPDASASRPTPPEGPDEIETSLPPQGHPPPLARSIPSEYAV